MKYKVLYQTQINKETKQAGDLMEFPQGTDENYIKRLIAAAVVEPLDEGDKDANKKSSKK